MTLCCSQGTLCFEMTKGIPAAFVALVVGCMAGYIAWQQHETAKAKLKLDLFEKRYAIFEKTWTHLSEAIQTGPGPTPFSTFDNIIPQAKFLFGPEVETYLKEISSKKSELWMIHSRTKASGDVMAPGDIQRHTKLMKWFCAEASTGAKEVFGPWLNFKNWK
jgi:hypothetical protein